jgi:hypothetical protein
LLGRSQAVGTDGLATSSSNLNCFKENFNFKFYLFCF